MARSAQVHSVEVIESVKDALVKFSAHVDQSVSGLQAEVRRTLEYLEHDRPRFWKTQLHKAREELHEAQMALHRCLMFPINDERPSCYEERIAVKRAEARLVYCEEKTERVRYWVREIHQEKFNFDARVGKLTRSIDWDTACGIAVLLKLIQRLEEYQSLSPKKGMEVYDGAKLAEQVFREAEEELAEKKEVLRVKSRELRDKTKEPESKEES